MQVENGILATQLPMARWRKSQASNPSGCCVEVATLPDGAIAVRNSRDPAGPALVYTRAEVGAFMTGVKNGEFDDLYPGGSLALGPEATAVDLGMQHPGQHRFRPGHRPLPSQQPGIPPWARGPYGDGLFSRVLRPL
jgi:hypothetical protein